MVRPESRLPDDEGHVEALQTTNPEEGPLAGVSVVDLTHFLAGPYASLCLAEMGASITKVEDPERPDEARLVGPHFLGGESLYFLSLNWAKESLAVRLSSDRGRKALLRVVADADVVLDNFRPGVMEKLGLGHEQLREANPQIVSCSLSGYGDTGPYREQPGYDYTIQALSGVMSLTGEPDGPPGKAGISYVDHAAGLAAGMAVCAALVGRARGSGGRHIDMSLLDVQISMLSYVAAWGLNGRSLPAREQSGAHPSIVPAQTFATRDGHVSVFVGNDEIWGRLVGVLSRPELRDERFADGKSRYRHRRELLPCLEALFSEWATADLVEALRERRVPCAPVNSVSAALEDPQVSARLASWQPCTIRATGPTGPPGVRSALSRPLARALRYWAKIARRYSCEPGSQSPRSTR